MPSRSATAASTNQANRLSKYRRSPASVPTALIPIHRLYGRAATLLANDYLRNNPLHIRNTSCHDISPTSTRITTFSYPRSSDLVASRLQHRPRIAPRVGEQRKTPCGVLLCDCKFIGGHFGRARPRGVMLFWHDIVLLLTEGAVLPPYRPTSIGWQMQVFTAKLAAGEQPGVIESGLQQK